MAQISLDTMEKVEKLRNQLHEKVRTTYTAFEYDGKKYVQFDTYGRGDVNSGSRADLARTLSRGVTAF